MEFLQVLPSSLRYLDIEKNGLSDLWVEVNYPKNRGLYDELLKEKQLIIKS